MRRSLRWFVPVLVVAGLGLAGWLIVTGGDDDTASTASTTTVATRATGTLDVGDSSEKDVAALGHFVFPTSTADFLTASTGDGHQIDLTFTFDPGESASFIAGSGLPMPAAGKRVITHSSPLWKLNPDGTIRGAEDAVTAKDGKDAVRRQVELVDENGRIRVRAVLTPAA